MSATPPSIPSGMPRAFRVLFRILVVVGLGLGRADILAREWVYERDIAPVLRTHCAGCHNDADREGEFSLETFAGLRRGGDKGGTIRPGTRRARCW